jgi:hypothetical protein
MHNVDPLLGEATNKKRAQLHREIMSIPDERLRSNLEHSFDKFQSFLNDDLAPYLPKPDPMSKVLVIELPDETADPRDALILLAHGSSVDGSHVHVAIREDAERVLAVFTPDPQEHP